jgi:hypothetical protein
VDTGPVSALKVRAGGAWVDSSAVGSARVAGAWVPYGPDGGGEPTYERLTWPDPPAVTDQFDGDQAYNMGIEFSVASTRPCIGVSWRVPDQILNPPGGLHVLSLWKPDPGNTRLRFRAMTAPELTPGADQDFLFIDGDGDPDPVTLTPGNYIAAAFTVHYVYRGSAAAGASSPSGNLASVTGRLHVNGGGEESNVYPELTTGTLFYVTPIVQV